MNNQKEISAKITKAFEEEIAKAYEKLSDFVNNLVEAEQVPVQFVAGALSRELSITTAILVLGAVGEDREKAVALIEKFGEAIVSGTVEAFDDILANALKAAEEEASA